VRSLINRLCLLSRVAHLGVARCCDLELGRPLVDSYNSYREGRLSKACRANW
jgi:hypothetical protein